MSRAKTDDGLAKHQPHRRARRENAMKLRHVEVPDPTATGSRAQARRQALTLRDAPEEAEALRFIEVAAHWPEG